MKRYLRGVVYSALVSSLLSSASSAFAQSAPAIFVNMSTGQVASGTTPTAATTTSIAAPGAGWVYSAAAPVAGTTWNNILRPNPAIGSNSTSTIGQYVCNSANNIALSSSIGEATAVTLTVQIDIQDLEGNTTRTEPNSAAGGNTVLGPAGLMGQCWRIYRGGNGTIHRFSGLTAGAHYYLYGYGTTTTTGQGCKFTLDALNVPAGGATFVDVRGGNAGNIFTTDGSTFSLTAPAVAGVVSTASDNNSWGRLHAVADAGGQLVFRTAKNASNSQYINGYQLVPYPLPTISLQPPSGTTASLGGDATFTVTASGDGALTYQWRKDGAPITDGPGVGGSTYAGANTATLTVSGLTPADEGDYDVVVTNPGGGTPSGVSTLDVTSEAIAPTVVAPPTAVNAVTGAPAAFSVSANGTGPLFYQWQKSADNVSFSDIDGQTTAALNLASVTVNDAGYYRVVVTNSVDTATSASATLTVAPVLVTPPPAAIVAPGAAHSITVVADAGVGSPAPITYLWKRNGATISDGGVFSGAGTASLSLSSVGAAQSGYYTVTASNLAGAVTSASVYVGVATTGSVTFSPTAGALNVNPDAPLVVRFATPPLVGSAGAITVRRTADDSVVETIDLGALPTLTNGAAIYRYKTRTIGDTSYNYLPVNVVGNEARITLQSSTALAYGVSYYVTVEAGALLDSTGASLAPVAGPASWSFSTKSAAPDAVPARTTFTVASDGSGDFSSVQAALNHIPSGNTTPVRIEIGAGVYDGIVNSGARHNLTLVGAGHDLTVVQALNNNVLNGGTSGRVGVTLKGNDLLVRDLALVNTTPKGGSQAEALRSDGQRVVYLSCAFRSFQDTLLLGGTSYFQDCLIAGDTDYIWGGGTAMFKNCELLCLNPAELTQNRAPANKFGFVFLNCALTKPAGASFSYGLGRNSDNSNVAFIDSRMDTHISAGAWSTGFGSVLRNWEYASMNLAGTALIDVSGRVNGRQLTETEAAILRIPANVYGSTPDGTPAGAVGDGWTPVVPALAAPVIVTDPVGRTVSVGQSVTFSVTASGSAYFTYQWRKGGDDLPGQVGSSLTIASAAFADEGSYDCVVTSSGGSTPSAAASLSVLTPVDNWAAGFGLDGTAPGFASADADGDGVANLLEYVLGGDPTQADAGILPQVTMIEDEGGKYLILEYTRAVAAASAVDTAIETTADLATWSTRTPGVDAEVDIIPFLGFGLNVDVNNSAANNYTGLAVAPGDGLVWNGITTGAPNLTDLLAASGEPTTVDLAVTSSGGFSAWSNTTNGAPNPLLLMQDYYFGNTYTATLSSLPPGSYQLIVYAHGDQDAQTSTVTVSAANGGGTKGTAANGGAFRDAFATGAEGVAYVKFTPTVGAAGTLQFSSGNYLNGFQLVQVIDPDHEIVRVTIPFTGARLFARLRATAE
jgi:pectin methylesterase-like acyl-CoA thioesterase